MIPDRISVHTEFADGSQTTQVSFGMTGPNGNLFRTIALVETNLDEGVQEREVQGPYVATREGLLEEMSVRYLRTGVAIAVVDDVTNPASYYWHTASEFGDVKERWAHMEMVELPMPDLFVKNRRCDVTLFVFSERTEPPRASAYLLPWALSGHVLGADDHPTFTYAFVKLARY